MAVIKQLAKYANVTTAYPEYEMEEAVYELKVVPQQLDTAEKLLNNASVVLN